MNTVCVLLFRCISYPGSQELGCGKMPTALTTERGPNEVSRMCTEESHINIEMQCWLHTLNRNDICRHCDHGILAFSTLRNYITTVEVTPSMGILLE